MLLETIQGLELFGNPLIDFGGVGELALRFGIDLLVIYAIIRWIFYPIYRHRTFFFSCFVVNIAVFLVCIILNSIKLKIGFAFGLFAVFSIIRYRTEQIPIKEMTYLFVTIIVGVINALSVKNISYAELLLSNGIIVVSLYILEYKMLPSADNVKKVRYEKIELITNTKDMIKDLRERTGLDVTNVYVEEIDFLNDTAILKVFYRDRRRSRKEIPLWE